MKFPLVTRSRFDSEMARWRNRLERERSRVAQAKALAAQARSGAVEARRKLAQIQQVCELRSNEVESLQRQSTSEREWLHEVERICEVRATQIEILQSQLADEERAHSLVLAELARVSRSGGNAAGARDSGPGPAWVRERDAPIPVVLGIDIEPDAREVDRANPVWDGAGRFFEQLPEFRDRLAQMTGAGAPLSWFVRADPQVAISNGSASWAFETFADHWRECVGHGDEIGLHVHPWRWNEAAGRWLQDFGDEPWLHHCIDMAISTYRSFFGRGPTSYRGGDRFLSNGVRRQIEETGVKVDLSVERMPGVERLVSYELGAGQIPDTWDAPACAFWPSDADFRRPGPVRASGFGIMPLSSYPAGSLRAWMNSVDFQNGLEWTLGDARRVTHLAFVVRANIAGSDFWERFCRNADTLADLARSGRFEFMTAIGAWQRVRRWLGYDSTRE